MAVGIYKDGGKHIPSMMASHQGPPLCIPHPPSGPHRGLPRGGPGPVSSQGRQRVHGCSCESSEQQGEPGGVPGRLRPHAWERRGGTFHVMS